MPLTFLQAKEKVSPNKPVKPGSAEHLEIMALMRQSGHVFPEDNTPAPTLPPPKVIADLKLFRERPAIPKPKPLSKKEWLSLPSNKKSYDDHIAQHNFLPPGALEPPPPHLSWAGMAASYSKGMSKRQWIASLK
jgi:hypothetical protein